MSNPSTPDPRLVAALRSMSGADEASVASFHDQFFSLDPVNARLVARDQLLAALPKRHQMFASIGATGTTLRDLTVHEIDAGHALVETRWDVDVHQHSTEPLTLEAAYLMRRFGEDWKVIVYINHHDIAAVIADRRRHHGQDR